MIPFNKCYESPNALDLLAEAISDGHLSGDGRFTKQCHQWFEERLGCPKALLTPSCTAALEMAAILIDIQPGDEVIMPSYTFVSTANAFVLRGAKIVFVDIRADTMNIDEQLIEQAITEKTKAIIPVHYAGIACEMDTIMDIANRHKLYVIEDAAQGVLATYKGRALGTIGHIGTYSFHATKNYTSGGEGGLLIINDQKFVDKAEIIREKGTNRRQFVKGKIDKYTWVDIGGSHLASELQAAYLYSQLTYADSINKKRLAIWEDYQKFFAKFSSKLVQVQPIAPKNCLHNAHMFYIKLPSKALRESLIRHLNKMQIACAPHYIPLHSSSFGLEHSIFHGEDQFTTTESERLLRLPMFYELSSEEVEKTVSTIFEWVSRQTNNEAI